MGMENSLIINLLLCILKFRLYSELGTNTFLLIALPFYRNHQLRKL